MAKKPKIDVVKIDLGIDIAEEIKKETDHISKETKAQIQAAASSSRPQNRKTKAEQAKERRKQLVEPIFNLLVERTSDPSLFTSRTEITEILNIQSSEFGALVSRLRAFIKEEYGRKWELVKSSSKREPAYRLKSTID